MTIEEKIKELLVSNGLSADAAATVIQTAKEDEMLATITQRWQEDTAGYPLSVLSLLWFSMKVIALEWDSSQLPSGEAIRR